MAREIKERGIDLLAPVWNFMDLTPQGRREWYPSLAYGTKAGRPQSRSTNICVSERRSRQTRARLQQPTLTRVRCGLP
jgi:hypothetical protein